MQPSKPETSALIHSQRSAIRLLLIEDNAGDVLWVKKILCGMSLVVTFDVTHVPRMSDAFETLDQQSYDIALLDLNLLDIRGVATVTALHAHAPSLPIIVYSGCDDLHLLEEAVLCGATDYLTKKRELIFLLPYMIQQSLASHAA